MNYHYEEATMKNKLARNINSLITHFKKIRMEIGAIVTYHHE